MKQEVEKEKTKKRIYYLDILRVIACLTVIMIHTSATYVVRNFGTFNFWIGNLFDSLSRIAVPLFIMISGALLLDEKYELNNKKLIMHIVKMVIFFVCWSVIYCIIYQIIVPVFFQNKSINFLEILAALVQGHYHLWFIYLIVGLYLILPLLKTWVNKNNKKYVEYFIALSLIFTYIIPEILSVGSNYSNIFVHLNNIFEKQLCLKYVGGYTTYFLLGWYIHNFDFKCKHQVYILALVGFFVTFIGTALLSITTNQPIQLYDNLYINVLFQAVAVFLAIKTKFHNVSNENGRVVHFISTNSLAIYAVHALFIDIAYALIAQFQMTNAIINIPIVFLFSLLISTIVSHILHKIPGLNKIV